MWITAALQAARNVGWTIFWIFALQIPVKQGISCLRPYRAGLGYAPRSPQNHNFPETSVVRRYERRISKGIGSPYIRAEAKLVSVVRPFGQKIGPVSRAQKTGFF
jgi:hypothetical protein